MHKNIFKETRFLLGDRRYAGTEATFSSLPYSKQHISAILRRHRLSKVTPSLIDRLPPEDSTSEPAAVNRAHALLPGLC